MPLKILENECLLNAPFGSIKLTFSGDRLIRSELFKEHCKDALGRFEENRAVKDLRAYIKGNLKALEGWPASSEGSEFRRKVWQEIAKIPAGETVTYGQIAARLQSSPRAVGGACGDNPLPVFVGCHRVVGKSNLGGFNHKTEDVSIKSWLLNHEKAVRK